MTSAAPPSDGVRELASSSEIQHRARTRPPGSRPTAASSFWTRLGVVALIPIVFYSVAVVAEKSLETYRLRQEAGLLRAEIEAERRENLRLQQELVEARDDQQIEDAARRYLNLIKPGDQPVVLTGPPPPATPTPRTVAAPAATEELPDWLTSFLERIGR